MISTRRMLGIAGLLHLQGVSLADQAQTNETTPEQPEPSLTPDIESRQVRRARKRREAKNGRIVRA